MLRIHLFHEAGHLPESQQLAGPEPPFAGDEFVPVAGGPHGQGLDEPHLCDADRQGLELLPIESPARLIRVGADAVDGQQKQIPF